MWIGNEIHGQQALAVNFMSFFFVCMLLKVKKTDPERCDMRRMSEKKVQWGNHIELEISKTSSMLIRRIINQCLHLTKGGININASKSIHENCIVFFSQYFYIEFLMFSRCAMTTGKLRIANNMSTNATNGVNCFRSKTNLAFFFCNFKCLLRSGTKSVGIESATRVWKKIWHDHRHYKS